MTFSRRLVASLSLVAVAASVAGAAPRLLADLTGKWAFTAVTPQGSQASLLTLTQKADSISGTLESPLGSAPIAGVVQGDSVKFAFQLDMGGQQLIINGAGLIKDKDNMEGMIDVAGVGAMPFSAARQP